MVPPSSRWFGSVRPLGESESVLVCVPTPESDVRGEEREKKKEERDCTRVLV